LKIKLSQIFFQEKQDAIRGLEIIKEALDLDPENIEAMLLQGKMLIKEKRGKEAVEIVERSLLL
jgi:cytochrome c-type biogenesis protein CcmH/NrfG|tara:strand:- start:682 stop:873 length:192 start_codon:yes stop_codon:yes gene_type:complete